MKTRAAVTSGASRAVTPRSTRAVRANGSTPPAPTQPVAGAWEAPLPVADPGTIVGRQAELARLRALWRAATAGKTQFVLVAGEPGAGKTRLAAELAGIVETAGAPVLVGTCRPDDREPYQPFVDALRPALAAQPAESTEAFVRKHGSALSLVFPDVPGLAASGDGEPSTGPRTTLLATVAAAVTSLAREPLLLVLEDLHWATRSTVLVLEQLVRHSSTARLLVLATYRDDAIDPCHPLAEILDGPLSPHFERLAVPGLSPQAVTALLVDRAAVAGRAAATLARSLWLRTEGNPLLLTEVVRDLVGGGALPGGTVNPEVVETIGVPHQVSDLVMRRVGRTGTAIRRALDVASVVGTSFSADLVAAVGDQKLESVRAALDRAVASGVVAPLEGKPGSYRFAHDLFHRAIYEALSANRRVRLHFELAELLEQPDRMKMVAPSVLVRHRAAAAPVGRSPHAVCHALRAGEAALRVLAFEEAAAFFGQALVFLGNTGDAADAGTRADLLMLLAGAYHGAGESSRARQSYLQAAAVAKARKDGPRLGRAVLGLGDVVGVWGADGVLIGLLDQAVAANPEDPSLRAKLIARLAQARAALDTPDELKEQSDRAWELAWDSKDPDTMGSVLRARHEALSAPDDLEDRVEIDGELFAMASNAKDPSLALLVHGWRLVDLFEQGHVVDADRDRKAHAQLARRSGDPRHQRDAALWAAAWALLEGRTRRATTHIDRALALGQQARDPDAACFYWTQQMGLLLEWGSDAEIDSLIKVWRDLVHRHDGHPRWRASLALLLTYRGYDDEAGVELDDLLAEDCTDLAQDRSWLDTVAAIGEVAARLEDPRCSYLAKLLSPYARRLVIVGPGLHCRGPVARVLGMLSATAGNWVAAERNFQAALSTAERLDSRPMAARVRSEFGQALARKAGGPLHVGRVKKTLEQAAEEAAQARMTRLLAETRTALTGLG